MKLEYTGERMVPEDADLNTFWEHIYRYRFAIPYVKGKKVLDIACGEGYGSAALLRSGAADLIGVDISSEACEHATKRYGIKTSVGDAVHIPLPDKSAEVVVSFETIEHTEHPELFIAECARVLLPGGKIIMSTPNLASRDGQVSSNPFHLKELTAEEFLTSLGEHFQDIEVFSQRPSYASSWSFRSLAASDALWQKLPGFGRLRRCLHQLFAQELQSSSHLEKARLAPIEAILSRSKVTTLANPFAIRVYKSSTNEIPNYFIAIGTVKNPELATGTP